MGYYTLGLISVNKFGIMSDYEYKKGQNQDRSRRFS